MAGVYPASGVAASAALNSVNVATTGCGGDTGELFHSTNRCTPRFDPAAANAVMSEILNAVTRSCPGTPAPSVGVPYDCTRLDNLHLAICRIATDIAAEIIFDPCLPGVLPDLGDQCGDISSVVWVQNGACGRFAIASSTAAARGNGTFRQAHPERPADTQGLTVPDDFADPNDFYTSVADYQQDIINNTLDEGRVNNSLLATGTVTLPCATRLSSEFSMLMRSPPLAQDAYTARVRVAQRWRINGGAWQYPMVGATPTASTPVNSLQTSTVRLDFGDRVYPAGTLEMQFIYIGEGNNPARIGANTTAFGSAIAQPTPQFLLNPAL